jgi:two-component system cell cycle response regulator DivK
MPIREQAPLVLIVDDVEDVRDYCAEFLALRNFRVATAGDGLEALAKAEELLPDVILMDLALPLLDGWEATRRLKGDERTRHIRVIALTARPLDEARSKGLAVGCDAVLTKLCLPQELELEIRRQLEEARRVSP